MTEEQSCASWANIAYRVLTSMSHLEHSACDTEGCVFTRHMSATYIQRSRHGTHSVLYLDIHTQRMREATQDHDRAPNHEEVTREVLQRYCLDDGIVCQRADKSLRQCPAACHMPILSVAPVYPSTQPPYMHHPFRSPSPPLRLFFKPEAHH